METLKNDSIAYKSASLRQKHLQFALISGVLVCMAIILYTFDPITFSLYPTASSLRLVMAFLCPGLATLGGLHQLLQGNILAALNLSPLLAIALPFLAYFYLSLAVEVMMGRKLSLSQVRVRVN